MKRLIALLAVCCFLSIASTAQAQENPFKKTKSPDSSLNPFEKKVQEDPSKDSPSSERPSDASARPVSSRGVTIVLSHKGDSAWGFSKQTGTWKKQAIEPRSDKTLVPVLAANVAFIRNDRKIYGFNGKTGAWSVLEVPGEAEIKVAIDDGSITVRSGSRLFTLAGTSATWTSPQAEANTGASGKPRRAGEDSSDGTASKKHEPAAPEEQALSVFPFLHGRAEAFRPLLFNLAELFDVNGFAVLPTSNVMVFRATGAKSADARAVLTAIDALYDPKYEHRDDAAEETRRVRTVYGGRPTYGQKTVFLIYPLKHASAPEAADAVARLYGGTVVQIVQGEAQSERHRVRAVGLRGVGGKLGGMGGGIGGGGPGAAMGGLAGGSVTSLPPEQFFVLPDDPRHVKALLIATRESEVDKLRSAIEILDRSAMKPPTASAAASREPQRSPESLRRAYEAIEQQVRSVANLVRKQSPRPADAESSLAKYVARAFQARQIWQRAQIRLLEQRLADLRSRVERRERNKDAIIGRRVRELLGSESRSGGAAVSWTPIEPDKNPPNDPQRKAERESVRRVVKAEQERRDLLEQRFRAMKEEFRTGRASQLELLRAMLEYYQAKLKLTAGPREQIKVLKECTTLVDQYRIQAEAAYRSGVLKASDYFAVLAEAKRIEAELGLPASRSPDSKQSEKEGGTKSSSTKKNSTTKK